MRSLVARTGMFLVLVGAVGMLAVAGSSRGSSAGPSTRASAAQVAALRQKIQHVVVVFQENWSFDGLYAGFPGADAAGSTGTPQLQCPPGATRYVPLTASAPAYSPSGFPDGPWPCGWRSLAGGVVDTNIPTGLPLRPFDLSRYEPPTMTTGDLWHIFWHEQLQIDNGVLEPSNGVPMGKFAMWSNNPGLVVSHYDASKMPEGRVARRYTMADHVFHSAFGGSYLNHQWLICACTPRWDQPLPTQTPYAFISTWNPVMKLLDDGSVSTMPQPGVQGAPLWTVNTVYSANSPHPADVGADQLLAPIPSTQKTIGDLLTDHQPSISWKWYAGDWDRALRGDPKATECASPSRTNPHPLQSSDCFQFHHQPFVYYRRWGTDGSPQKAAHLQDEQRFFADLKRGTLPHVSFIKPVGVDNEHPSYANLTQGQLHVQRLIQALCDSSAWKSTALIIIYDENGGRWDHVAPPKIDQWGPGTRVPAIVVSPYAKPHYIDHTPYETVSILSLIERRFGLPALGPRDANANPMLGAFDFTQAPLACRAS